MSRSVPQTKRCVCPVWTPEAFFYVRKQATLTKPLFPRTFSFKPSSRTLWPLLGTASVPGFEYPMRFTQAPYMTRREWSAPLAELDTPRTTGQGEKAARLFLIMDQTWINS